MNIILLKFGLNDFQISWQAAGNASLKMSNVNIYISSLLILIDIIGLVFTSPASKQCPAVYSKYAIVQSLTVNIYIKNNERIVNSRLLLFFIMMRFHGSWYNNVVITSN